MKLSKDNIFLNQQEPGGVDMFFTTVVFKNSTREYISEEFTNQKDLNEYLLTVAETQDVDLVSCQEQQMILQ